MTILRSFALSLVLAIPLAACGSSKSAGAGGTTTAAATAGANAGVTALAAKLGVSENIVNGALTAAKAALGTPEGKTDAEKATAAQAGVDKASADATAAGTPLNDDQKKGLLEGLKGML